MNFENLSFSSKSFEFAEHEDYLTLYQRLCFYDSPNLNNVVLVSENAEEIAKTLIDMPVVAKHYKTLLGQDSFKGHEVTIDSDGDVSFETSAIGVYTDVEVKTDIVEDVNGIVREMLCLFATSKIWKRNKNVISAIKRLHSENRLFTSWEISVGEYTYRDGAKYISQYSFIGSALLGEDHPPAYGKSATALTVSSKDDTNLLLVAALTKDIDIQKNKEEVDNLKDVKKKTEISEEEEAKVEESAVETKQAESETEIQSSEETKVESVESEEATVETEDAPQSEEIQAEDTNTSEEKVEISALTENDLRRKIEKKLEKKTDGWAYVAWLFPGENTAWVKDGRAESELEYLLVTYSVLDDDVEISEPKRMKLTASLMEMDRRFSEMNSAIAEANSTIQTLNTEISNLTVFKEKFEASEQERIEAELAEKQNGLKDYAISSGLIAEDEVESDETIKTAISSVDKASIDAIIAERFMASKAEKKEKGAIETSEKKAPKAEDVKLNLASSDSYADAVSEFKKTYINKN